ncbi:hypothetical protein AFV8_gp03 [Betalipothrixvirus puteoliense]|uniref:Uncharacterized protein n=1 Tax=Betalipothrixvirus puteoliense TaxID=346884 RepID=A7WKT3_9VIRU|nr:hypothetical protein AFV8_gp03 [Acidianus filamentous virus 8]CAJ31680.1 conserved hypothetical protein [Acidianus filamentous virus 8]
MKIKVRIEGEIDVSAIQDIFEALGTTKINLTKSERLKEIDELKEIEDKIIQEATTTLGINVVIKELIITKSGKYILQAEG